MSTPLTQREPPADRFPRAVCALCTHLCLLHQTAEYAITKIIDGSIRRMRICDACAKIRHEGFKYEKVADA